jgi:ribosomal protein L11 methyltransferase
LANSWWEIVVRCHPTLEESVFWRLDQFGCAGTSTELKGKHCIVTAYYPQDQAQLLDLAALSLWFRQDALSLWETPPVVHWGIVDNEDWSSTWKAHWQPEEVGDHFLICPAWIDPPPSDRYILRLDPGPAFGTGAHATTQLCLEGLEMRLDEDAEGMLIADIGCGSGILAIAAVQLGVKCAYGVDTDAMAVATAERNRELNQIDPDRLWLQTGSLDTLIETLPAPVDGFVCNIVAETIIDLIPQMDKIAKPSTWGTISGVLMEQVKPIADTLEQSGWVIATLWRRKEWCCFNVRRAS